MAALHKYTSYRAALKTDVLRDQLQKKKGSATRMQQIFTPKQKQIAKVDFVPAFICSPWLLLVYTCISLKVKTVYVQLLPVLPNQMQTFCWKKVWSFSWTSSLRCLSADGCHTFYLFICLFFYSQPKWNVMSCQ